MCFQQFKPHMLFIFSVVPGLEHRLFLPPLSSTELIKFKGGAEAQSQSDMEQTMRNGVCRKKVQITHRADVVYKRAENRERRPHCSSTYSSGTFPYAFLSMTGVYNFDAQNMEVDLVKAYVFCYNQSCKSSEATQDFVACRLCKLSRYCVSVFEGILGIS